MKGLLKNNYYQIMGNMGLFLGFLMVFALVLVISDSQSLIVAFLYSAMMGSSLSVCLALGQKDRGKWATYLLTLPVKRKTLVQSIFLTQVFSLLTGMLLSAMVLAFIFGLQGNPFDKGLDSLLIYSSALAISLFLAAIFFPLSIMDHKDRRESLAILSLFAAMGLVAGLIRVINYFLPNPTNLALVISSGLLILVALMAYGFSYKLSLKLYLAKEF